MNKMRKCFVETSTWTAIGMVLVALVVESGVAGPSAHRPTAAALREKKMETTQGKFYCNIKALTPEERAHHKQLTEKLLAMRKEIVETAKGYEFQFSPKSVSLAELADWVSAESKCCPFFDFHMDLEGEGSLLCLRLTGEERIKPFIRAEFQVPAK
jgi:hypothetical protein